MTERTHEQITDEIRDRILELYRLTAEDQEDATAMRAPAVSAWVLAAAVTGFDEDGDACEDGYLGHDGPYRLVLGTALDALDYLRDRRNRED